MPKRHVLVACMCLCRRFIKCNLSIRPFYFAVARQEIIIFIQFTELEWNRFNLVCVPLFSIFATKSFKRSQEVILYILGHQPILIRFLYVSGDTSIIYMPCCQARHKDLIQLLLHFRWIYLIHEFIYLLHSSLTGNCIPYNLLQCGSRYNLTNDIKHTV